MPMSNRIKKRNLIILLLLGILSLAALFFRLYYEFQLSILNVFLLGIGLASLFTGVSFMIRLPKETLRIMDFLYYGIAMFGVIFFFGAQQAERNNASPKLQLVTVEYALEKALAEKSKLERMSGNPDYDIDASIDAILNWLYVKSREAFAKACRRSKWSSKTPPEVYFTCHSEGDFNQIRDKYLARFWETAGASSKEEPDAIDIQTTALSSPQAFLDAILKIREALGDTSFLWREIDWSGNALQSMKDLELALSVQGDGEHFRITWENNQVRLGELESEKISLRTAMEREAAMSEKSYPHAVMQWVIYNVWPILLILALSIKLAKTAQTE